LALKQSLGGVASRVSNSTIVGVGRSVFTPVSVANNVAATLQAVGWIAGTLGVGIWGSVCVGLGLLGVLAVIALIKAHRRMDMRPTFDVSVEPTRTYSSGFHESPRGGDAFACSVWVTADKFAERCYGRIIACERREGASFEPFSFGVAETGWPKSQLEDTIDIEPGPPQQLVVCIGLKDGNEVWLGTNTGGLGNPTRLPPGEYRINVRVGFRGWNVPDKPTECWFRLKHGGVWNQVELLEDPP
jgi:hypothetical protein